MNESIISLFHGRKKIYFSVDSVVNPDSTVPDDRYDEITDELLHSLNPPSLPPHILTLKIGAPVMLIRNLNIKKGLCNGTRLIVTDIRDTLISVKFPNGSETFPIPRIPLIGSDGSLPFHIKRLQFPIRLAFSMTINKSQGQTFDKVAIHLEKHVFAHGQLYVALSRVRKIDDLAIYLGKSTGDTSNIARNVVYPEVVNTIDTRN
jgi:ATP-dependent exoDNAse (exonuclease V) alpha subunit